MKFKEKYTLAAGFENLFSFKNKEEELEHEAKMIMFRFLSELEKIAGEKPIKKKELAKAIHTSPSYVTQLFRGDKLVNLLTLAKFQDFYDITFHIEARFNAENYKKEVEQNYGHLMPASNTPDDNGYWVYMSKNPDYNYNDVDPFKNSNTLKVA